LTAAEAALRLRRDGPNALRPVEGTPWWLVLWHQVASVVVGLLFVAALVAWFIGDPLDSAAILAVLLVNIVIGFWTEWRARTAMHALSRLEVPTAVVVRDGRQLAIEAREIVPGDLLVLDSGASVGADARIIEANDLSTNEAPLTGESLPVRKDTRPVGEGEPEAVALADRTSMVYKGTLIAAGSGRAVVTATGLSTEIGRVSELVRGIEDEPTPLEKRLDRLGRRLIWITFGVAGTIALIGIARGRELWLMIETGIALAIAAVPEGLPVVFTITQAVGLRRMARRRALVRNPPAVEGLGSATVVCSDKTGTLTAGEMTLTHIVLREGEVRVGGVGLSPDGSFELDGREADPADVPGLLDALTIGVLTNDAGLAEEAGTHRATGDPTEVALLVAGRKAGLDDRRISELGERVATIPFASRLQLSASSHAGEEGVRTSVKGAPSRILELSTHELVDGVATPLDDAAREHWTEENRRLAGLGLRVLAVAYRDEPGQVGPTPDELGALVLVGLVGISDPPAEGVGRTIERLTTAGIRTIMVTGDQPTTAKAVAEEIGIPGGEVLTGPELVGATVEQLGERLGRVAAFARVSPEDKVRIVEALQEQGEIVAMLGDGVNDAPALKRADVGVAMGVRGTDVAKETADLVLGDDRFETIGAAVEEGRVIYDNVRKFIFYLFSCNASELGVLGMAAFTTLPQPLIPLQILWLNLVTDVFPALALAVEPAEPEVMRRPPEDPRSAILSRAFAGTVLGHASVLTLVTTGVFLGTVTGTFGAPEMATTLTFQTLAFSQLFHVFNARGVGALRGRRWLTNRWIWAALALTTALQFAAVYVPALSAILRTQAMTPAHWVLVLGASLVPLVLGQARRRIIEASA
jgi:Ca2+-transporting ATPase